MSNVLDQSSLQQSDTSSMLQSTNINTDKLEPLLPSQSDEIVKALLPSAIEDSTLQHKTTSVEQPTTKRSITLSSTDDTTSINKSTPLNENSNETSSPTNEGNNNNEVVLTFPQRLMEMLDDPTNAEMMAWLPHGRAFVIYRKREFATEILPKYFQKAAKYSSFTRKLNRWGFVRVTRGPETGAYYHRLFRRNERRLVLQMTCHTSVSNSNNNNNAASITSTGATKRVSGGSHTIVENDALPMMMYPNQLDPSSQYMFPNPNIGLQSHSSFYPPMQQQQYYGGPTAFNNMNYNMYDQLTMDGMLLPSHSEDGQYYGATTSNNVNAMYPNHSGMSSRQSSGQQPPFFDPYAQSFYNMQNQPYGDNITSRLASTQYDDDIQLPSSMELSSSLATDDMGISKQQYSDIDTSNKYSQRMKRGMSSFHQGEKVSRKDIQHQGQNYSSYHQNQYGTSVDDVYSSSSIQQQQQQTEIGMPNTYMNDSEQQLQYTQDHQLQQSMIQNINGDNNNNNNNINHSTMMNDHHLQMFSPAKRRHS